MKIIKGRGIESVKGITTAGIFCGIKEGNKKDLAVIVSDTICETAGVFTKNRIKAAPVLWSRKVVKSGKAKAIVINSGNANACTGSIGVKNVEEMAQETASLLGVDKNKVMVCSTGVIGVPLPMSKIKRGIKLAFEGLSSGNRGCAAEAIMTTDTFPKSCSVEFRLKEKKIRIGGIAKGSGMIHPKMATMLSFLATDILITPSLLKLALHNSVDRSFNLITVDGETSTNDTVLIMATGKSGNKRVLKNSEEYDLFCDALNLVCKNLAEQVIKDGEGAEHMIRVHIAGANNFRDAQKVGMAVANSNLVKTAVFGGDPNWGRIIMAVGNAGVGIDFESIDLTIGNVSILAKGKLKKSAWEKKIAAILKKREVKIFINLNSGSSEVEVLTTDLTHEYIRINASYRT